MCATVLATTRSWRLDELAGHGVDHPILDDGDVAARVRVIQRGHRPPAGRERTRRAPYDCRQR